MVDLITRLLAPTKFNNRDILHKCIQSGTATALWLVETVSNCLLIGQNFSQESSGPVLFGSPESLPVVVDRIHWKLCQKASLHHILPQHRPLQQDSNWHFNLILSTVFFVITHYVVYDTISILLFQKMVIIDCDDFDIDKDYDDDDDDDNDEPIVNGPGVVRSIVGEVGKTSSSEIFRKFLRWCWW